jgi:hypothetical protein
MPFIVTFLMNRGLSEKIAKIGAAFAALILICLLILGGFLMVRSMVNNHDTTVVENHDKDLTIAAANMVIEADRAAALNRMDREEAFDNSQNEAKESVNEAQRIHVSPLDAMFDKLR